LIVVLQCLEVGQLQIPPRPRSKNASGNRTDIGWKHGTDVLGNGKKVRCNYCSKTFNGGIFRFKHHIAGTRYDSEPCVSVPKEVKVVMMKVVAEAKDVSEKKRRRNTFDEFDDEHIEEVDTNQSSSSMMFKNKGMEKFSQVVQYFKSAVQERG